MKMSLCHHLKLGNFLINEIPPLIILGPGLRLRTFYFRKLPYCFLTFVGRLRFLKAKRSDATSLN